MRQVDLKIVYIFHLDLDAVARRNPAGRQVTFE